MNYVSSILRLCFLFALRANLCLMQESTQTLFNVIDRSLQTVHADIVITSVYGELTVKQLELNPKVRLIPRNKTYQPIEVPENSDLMASQYSAEHAT